MVSSCSESARALESLEVQRYPIELEWVVNQGFAPYAPQPLLFVVDSYDHLFSLIERLEKWISEGRLNNVAPGYPDVNDRYLVEFLQGDSAPPATLAMPVLSDSEISKSLGRTTPMRKEAKWM
jgi:phenylalanine-4-hydroxylase